MKPTPKHPNVRIKPEQYARLLAYSERSGIPVSKLVEFAIGDFMINRGIWIPAQVEDDPD